MNEEGREKTPVDESTFSPGSGVFGGISEDQFLAIIDKLPALISYIDTEEVYRFINRSYTAWFGLERASVIGRTIQQVLGPVAYGQVRSKVNRALAGETVHFEGSINYKTVGEKYVSVSYFPDRGADGEVRGFFGVVNDVSSIKNAEQVIAGIRDRIKVVTESFADYAILSTDIEGRVETWNTGAENIFRYTEGEIIGRSADILFTPEDRAAGVPEREMKTAQTKGRALDERWHVRKDGSRFFASGVMSPLYEGGRLTGYAKIARDLTESRKMTEALQSAHDQMEVRVAERTRDLAEANEKLRAEYKERAEVESGRIRLLQRILTIQEDERRRISRDLHDQLGQLTTGLRLKIASLVEATSTDPEINARATKLQDIALSLDSEISFLAWELRPSALKELGLVEALSAFADGWSRHYDTAVEFHASGLKGIKLTHGIETHLYRVAQEALNNIAKHAKASRVNVIIENPNNSLVLIIEDDGVGFDPEEAMKIHQSGRGLGLIGIAERATLLGGEAEFESSPGKGATIYVRVPIEDTKDQPEVE